MSNVILVGEGRVGKTALCNRMMGKPVSGTESRSTLIFLDVGGRNLCDTTRHPFLKSYAVYVVVFNMVDILDVNYRAHSISELSFWINSIVMSGKMTPIFLVGTHGDVVSDISDQRRVSEMIAARIRCNAGWPQIQRYLDLCYFPVNNLTGQSDVAIEDLMTAIEKGVQDADYVKDSIPLTWLRASDALVATKKIILTLDEASSIALACGVETDAISLFFSFLSEMGVVLWLDEERLRDVIILDIMAFFVQPSTLITYNHISNSSGSTNIHSAIQEDCRQNNPEAWNQMMSKGVVGVDVLNALLGRLVQASSVPLVISMMLKYGLIVRLEHRNLRELPEEYLVPSLLPVATYVSHFHKSNSSCYFVFSTKQDMTLTRFRLSYLKNECFLPPELMARLSGRISNEDSRIYRNYALLEYDNQRFQLVCIPEINCIRLDVAGEHPIPVYNRVLEQLSVCVKEYMGSLQFITALRWGDSEFVLLDFQAIRRVRMTGRSPFVDGSLSVDDEYAAEHYRLWLSNDIHEEAYKISLRESYIPKPLLEDWKWYSDSYCENKISWKYFQKYAILHQKVFSQPFNSESEAFHHMLKHKEEGVVVHIGPKYIGKDLLVVTFGAENRYMVGVELLTVLCLTYYAF